MNDDTLYIEDISSLVGGARGGRKKIACPFCQDERSAAHRRDKPLSVDLDNMIFKCHHCDRSGRIKSRYEETMHKLDREFRSMAKTYKKPKTKPNIQPTLDEAMVEYFKGRGISEKTLLDAKVTKETYYFSQDQQKRGCIAFNYYLDGEHINTKYRTRDKHFTFIGGAKVVPYNIDSIREDAYADGETRYCIITEGEADTLTYLECGYKHTISMPAGANANLEWLDDFVESHFEKLDVIYVSTDSDKKGVEAKEELVRRFGADMVKVVQYPDDCKDINEVLVKYGRSKVVECYECAVDVKPKGIIEVQDIYDSVDDLFYNGLTKGKTIGVESVDSILSFKTGLLCVVTGIPSHGKTYMLNYILARLNIIHGWKVAFFSPEFYPVRDHVAQIIETLGGARFKKENYRPQEYEVLKEYTSRNYFWIDPDDTDINSILDRAKFLIRKKGIRVLVIDPFNSLTDKERKAQKKDEYISDFLQKIRWFARKYDVAIFLVMHPTKQQKLETGVYPVCDLYSCKGASEIYDKADIGLTVWRNEQGGYAELHVTKIKFRHLGEKGKATFKFNINNGRYVEMPNFDKLGDANIIDVCWDNSNYVTTKLNNVQQGTMQFETQQQYEPLSDLPFDNMQGDCPF